MTQPVGSQSSSVTLGEGKAETADDVIDLMEESGKKPSIKVQEVEEKKEEEVEEEEDEEKKEVPDEDELEVVDEDEEKEEEKLDLITPSKKKVILSKYPKLFEDFPYLEAAYFRDKQFTELLGTVNDAKEMIERAGKFDSIQENLFNGRTQDILKGIKDEDPDAFQKLTNNYLEDLRIVSKEHYIEVVSDVINTAIEGMVREAATLIGQDPESEDAVSLKTAAAILNKFMFGRANFVPSKSRKIEPSKEEIEFEKKKEEFNKTQFNTAQEEVIGTLDNRIRATIDRYIDPNNTMTNYVKKNAIKDAQEEVEKTLLRDKEWRSRILDPLWKKAFESNYSKTSKNAIIEAFTSKAKTLLPTAIKRARREALKENVGKREDIDRRGPLPAGRSSTSSSTSSGKTKEIPRGMSDMDFLMSK